ncbi:chromatin remodelling complex Rsc7/Swp82 subunit-domain-containing protein [Talaromyces proteolyticus]|uniref:Chromatin remodelling complex Rsc7/Swp82 subunit-domain-containing protein n=1 Tax=Talaromyces proteolyticus TaxID=1131652 RepID=A0AAD4KQW0_9EURO|nr:chromatin remodelling complex Rsc7/Swp82 subunit-domain-containing protein [Talaromyces proteolyticus]KAH8697301.1 chromatin remodelling complex Rsc7/Swp82 subunit-domain-containing protein [Talaromyces proteolyticus]
MYSAPHPVSAPINGIAGEIIDGSGTINPAALNSAASHPGAAVAQANTSPRGIKRSRSPDQYGDVGGEGDHEDDEHNRRKRGRPPKYPRAPNTATPSAPYMTNQQISATHGQVQTPRMQPHNIPNQNPISPPQASPPPKTTPTKTLVKALPTVRDHTTDTLNDVQDEYLPKEWDDAGEKKVDQLGYLQDAREYKCRTFRVPGRGEKLFMLATECARVLGYRDSYLLFNKNRSLYKIIASQPEKDDLIQQDILPYSYRSRQIAIVTARSMFRQFGSRVIVNGRRVRDDYWESKARKQGFTEEDLAGEKRPGAAKARDAAAAEAAANAGILPGISQSDIVYSSAIEGMPHLPPGMNSQAASLAPLPMIHLAPTTDDPRLREYSSMPRPRQELTGQAYQDRSQTTNAAEIANQATHTAEFNKILNSQRAFRQKGLEEFYTTPREVPTSSPGHSDAGAPVSQALQSPQMASSAGMMNQVHQQHRGVLAQQPQIMAQSQGTYVQQAQPGHIAQSPLPNTPQGMRPDALHSRATNPALSATSQTPQYGYQSQPQQMWGHPPPQPQPSLSASPHMGMPQYATQMPQQSPSPLPHGQQPHPSQSPHNQARPTQAIPQGLQMPPQVPQGMPAMGYQGVAFTNVANPRAMYAPSQNPGQQFLPGQGMAMGMGSGVGMPGWPSPAGMQPGQPQQGQSGSPLGGGWSGY